MQHGPTQALARFRFNVLSDHECCVIVTGGRWGSEIRSGIGARWLVIALGLASFGLGMSLLGTGRIGFDLFPSGDQSEVDITLVMPPAAAMLIV